MFSNALYSEYFDFPAVANCNLTLTYYRFIIANPIKVVSSSDFAVVDKYKTNKTFKNWIN